MQRIFFVFFLRVCLFHPHTRLALPDGSFKNISKWFNFNSSWNYTHKWVYFWWSAFSEIERCWNWFPPFRRMIRFDVEKWLSNMTEYHRRLVHSLRNLNAKTLRRGRTERISSWNSRQKKREYEGMWRRQLRMFLVPWSADGGEMEQLTMTFINMLD